MKNLSTSEVTIYYYLGDKLVAQNGSTLNYIHQEHLGSTSVTTSSSGSETSAIRYYPWGSARSTSGTVPTDKKFTGQRLLNDTELYYYGARYYNPGIGRFISPDTIVPNPMNPQSLNRYSYCLNNPLRYVDPTGHDEGNYDEFTGPPSDYDSYIEHLKRGGDSSYTRWHDASSFVHGIVRGLGNELLSFKDIPQNLHDFSMQDPFDLEAAFSRTMAFQSLVDYYSSKWNTAEGRGEVTAEAAFFFVMFLVPGGGGKNAAKLSAKASELEKAAQVLKGYKLDQRALIDLAKYAKAKGGLTVDEGKIMLEWAREYNLPAKGPYLSERGAWGPHNLHYRIGPVTHIPLKP